MYKLQFNGTPIADTALKLVRILPSDARDAFPSLHTAVTLLTLIFAFKYIRWQFWVLLPFCVGLLLATVYLRQHYVIDLFAGVILAIIAYYTIPPLDKWWQGKMQFYL